ncbi:phage tail protein [Nitratifractor salsuginis]|uniref:Phage tail protein I n=1 Tax=Nitratifractor salsuginis (strain DSM 16511 / JCM 12458 / E9I37-1) TaxID=749222 RepID=E6X1N3_NITSE|nr:phage tail protein [Nitratifractor salsuginis]ADV47024.1 hypothetical protein Nitsa_1779 [Nitratifractor salsuginis DSM 16511]
MCTDLLPLNIDPRINTLDRLGCERLEALQIAADELLNIGDPMRVDARYLDALAEDMQTYFLTGEEAEDQKRRAIANSFQIHRKKGTPWALTQAFGALDMGARIEEWFDYDGEPYHFRLDLSPTDKQITIELRDKLLESVNDLKNVRSTIDELVLSYLNVHTVAVSAGAVGESCSTAEPINGYTIEAASTLSAYAGAVGEASITIRGGAYE